MGKISPVSTKYIVYAAITIEGNVDRPDVIGAVFGQTEGFLGQDLELRELQRSGKVGRIEVKMEVNNGKSSGQIIIPCSLDKAETAIIGAALETIERIGPCNASVRVEKIEDVRIAKREFVIARAKELLSELQSKVLPDSQEITEEVAQSLRVQEATTWGPEQLPAGPAVDESEEIIIVEGRADVITLLKCGFKNTVALNGTSVPESIKGLCKEKTVTVFVDGDRGGDLIIRELTSIAEVDFITKAPAGKEVEELTQKEIHICLRSKIVATQYKFDPNSTTRKSYTRPMQDNRRSFKPNDSTNGNRNFRERTQIPRRPSQQPTQSLSDKNKESFKEMLDNLVGTRGAYIIDKDYNILGKVPTRELEATLKNLDNIFAVVLDGTVTKELTDAAEKSKVSFVIGRNSKIKPEEARTTILIQKDL
ncbi:DNA primase [Candidatus Woesearchaeota archaeon]|nr:DNA primase [Candidatus Woesearchaeota archaeon]